MTTTSSAPDPGRDGVLDAMRRDVATCREAHDRLLEVVTDLTDHQARSASALPGWSVGHVLTHIARNGDSVVHLSRAVANGEVADQYPGGVAQRTADIEAGAGRPAADLVADVRDVNERIHEVWTSLTDEQWSTGVVRTTAMGEKPATYLAAMRLREVVVHTSDLGLASSTWEQWPPAYVDAELPRLLEMLPDHLTADEARDLVAQLMGRRAAPLSLPSVMR